VVVAATVAAAAVVAPKSTFDAGVAACWTSFAPAALVCKEASPDVTV